MIPTPNQVAAHAEDASLSPSFSIYLDLVRFLAALSVFLEHAKPSGLMGSLGPFNNLSGEAVIAFFVLSGFIITKTTDPAAGWRRFAVARAARIYSVVVPAMLLGLIVKGAFAAYAGGDLAREYVGEDLSPWHLLATLAFLGQIWTLHIQIPWNGAIWSLHYEAFYYLLFGVAMFAPGRWRWPALSALVALAGPKIVILAPCWAAGVVLARCPDLAFPSRTIAWGAFIAAPLAIVLLNHAGVYDLLKDYLAAHVPAYWRLDDAQNFPGWYIDAVLIGANFIAARQLFRRPSAPLLRCGPVIQWAAGYTFSLYLFHRPFQNIVEQLYPSHEIGAATSAVFLIAMLAAVVALGSVTEQKKRLWRRIFTALLRDRRTAPALGGPEHFQRKCDQIKTAGPTDRRIAPVRVVPALECAPEHFQRKCDQIKSASLTDRRTAPAHAVPGLECAKPAIAQPDR